MKIHKLSFRMIIAVCLSVCLCAVSLSGCSKSKDTRLVKWCEFKPIGQDLTETVKNSEENTLLLQSQNKKLYINAEGVIYVTDEYDNVIWETAISSQSILENISDQDATRSMLTLNYQTDSIADQTMNTFGECFEKQQYTISKEDNKIVIQQIVGSFVGEILLPEAIEKSKFESLLEKVNERDYSYITRQYVLYTPETSKKAENAEVLKMVPNLSKNSFYVLNTGLTEIQKRRICDVFESIGYTKEDLDNDRKEAGISLTDQGLVFKVVTEFYFDNNDLVVNIPCDQVYYPVSTPLLAIDVFKYGNYVSEGSDGYYFVPSGSGAIFDYKSNKTPDYELRYYGEDYSNFKAKEQVDRSGYPVFGKTNGTEGYLAIIENGAECVDLNIKSAFEGYVMYPSINLFSYKPSVLGDGAFNLYSSNAVSEDITIRYAFLNDEGASYSSMANYYRNYLLDKSILSNNTQSKNLPFSMEIINSIQTEKEVAGIEYQTEKVVTTFEQTKEIISFFEEKGVSNLFVKLNGANSGGLFMQTPGRFKVNSQAGGQKDYRNLLEFCSEQNILLFNNLNFVFTYGEKVFDGYNANKHTVRTIDNNCLSLYVKEKSTNDNRADLATFDVVSPHFYKKYAEDYVDNGDTIGSGISIGELGWILNSDFSEDNYMLRSDTKNAVIESTEILGNTFGVMAENPNDYLLNKLVLGEKIPTENSGYRFFDKSVPFVQMLLHGNLQYTTEYWNSVPDNQTALLKAIETGSGISYRFAMTLEKEDMKNQNSFLYNTDYELWKETALENYNYVNDALKGLNTEAIINHKYIDDDIVCVTYSNGTKIYINYSEVQKTIDDVTVDAQSYVRK